MDDQIVQAAVSVIAACALFIARTLIRHYRGEAAARAFKKYEGIAVAAAKWAEERIPDDIGTDKDDPKWEKYFHRTDAYLQKFVEYHQRMTGRKPDESLLEEARRFGSEIARRISDNKVEVGVALDDPELEGRR